MKKLVRNYQNIAEKRLEKLKRSEIKYYLTIHFLTKTTQNCANFVDSLLVIRFSIFFAHISEMYISMTEQFND